MFVPVGTGHVRWGDIRSGQVRLWHIASC